MSFKALLHFHVGFFWYPGGESFLHFLWSQEEKSGFTSEEFPQQQTTQGRKTILLRDRWYVRLSRQVSKLQ